MPTMPTPAMLRAAVEGRPIADATPEGIVRSERAGQAALVASTNIPKQMRPNREAFEKIGFVFGEDVDELFVSATLPMGWTRAATDHAMHSNILDERGRERAHVFYKAAFYDRRADCHLVRRFSPETQYPGRPGGEALAADEIALVVKDGSREIHRSPAFKHSDRAAHEVQGQAIDAWLREQRPDHSDPTAYWDEPEEVAP